MIKQSCAIGIHLITLLLLVVLSCNSLFFCFSVLYDFWNFIIKQIWIKGAKLNLIMVMVMVMVMKTYMLEGIKELFVSQCWWMFRIAALMLLQSKSMLFIQFSKSPISWKQTNYGQILVNQYRWDGKNQKITLTAVLIAWEAASHWSVCFMKRAMVAANARISTSIRFSFINDSCTPPFTASTNKSDTFPAFLIASLFAFSVPKSFN